MERKGRRACAAGTLTRNQAVWLCVALPCGPTNGYMSDDTLMLLLVQSRSVAS